MLDKVDMILIFIGIPTICVMPVIFYFIYQAEVLENDPHVSPIVIATFCIWCCVFLGKAFQKIGGINPIASTFYGFTIGIIYTILLCFFAWLIVKLITILHSKRIVG